MMTTTTSTIRTWRVFAADDLERAIIATDVITDVLPLRRMKLYRDFLTSAVELGTTFTAEHNGRVIAVAGFLPEPYGRAEVWLAFAKDVTPADIRWLIITLRQRMQTLLHHPDFRFHRIDCIVPANWFSAQRIAELLGMHAEGLLRQYIDGHDCLMFAATRSTSVTTIARKYKSASNH